MHSTNKCVLVNRLLILSVFALFSFVFAILFVSYLTSTNTNAAQQISRSSNFEARVAEMLELKLSTCNSIDNTKVEVNIEPSVSGTFKSNCQEASVNTNAPGYSLSVKSDTLTMNYITPTTITPLPTISPTANTISAPGVLTNDTWGFAAENRLSFDNSYTIDESSNTYAAMPTTDTIIYSTDQFPIPISNHKFYYAARLTPATMAGSYATTITYTAIGEEVLSAPKTCKNVDSAPECIEFTVDVSDTGTYAVPTSGRVANMDHTYDWDVYVDGYLTDSCFDGNCAGISSITSIGIELNGLSNNQHQILIVPHDVAIPGWGNAFGYYSNTNGANVTINKSKLISLDSPLTTMAFAPKTTESTTGASYMFAYIFYSCTNLTTPATFVDTYKLPDTITNLSYFLRNIHSANNNLRYPVDLSSLSNWLSTNNTITNLSDFLASAHSSSPNIQSTINLSHISNWFRSNNSIINLSNFLSHTHNGNHSLQSPIDISPVSGWFNANNSITNLSYFLNATHTYNYNLQSPINLSPVSNWFNANNSITNLSNFLNETHIYNYFQSPIDLSPISDWFNANNSITNLSYFFNSTFLSNTSLQSSIDLTPLSGWFTDNRTITSQYGLDGFLNQTHYNNTSITIANQRTILPNWIKTMTHTYSGVTTPIWDVGSLTSSYTFYRTFYTTSTKAGDSSEVLFEDGTTVLSSIGTPSVNRETYTNRSGITPVNSNWQ